MLPGIMAMILQLLALANSAGQVVLEKEEGTLARDWSQGVPPQLSLLMQLLVQLLVVLAQVQRQSVPPQLALLRQLMVVLAQVQIIRV